MKGSNWHIAVFLLFCKSAVVFAVSARDEPKSMNAVVIAATDIANNFLFISTRRTACMVALVVSAFLCNS